MHRFLFLCLALLAGLTTLSADEGMWTFNNFPAEKVKQQYGFAPDQQWLDHVRLSSARLAQGCSGSFVSPNGLVLTNHHCASACISDLSRKGKDFLTEGFSAKSVAEEQRCPNLEVNQLTSISDVTSRMNAATAGKTGNTYNDARKAEQSRIEKECASGDDVRCEVVTLYSGGRYDLYKYRRFQDVRLVFAPEKAIAFFGGDPDNFMFPRYDLDVSFLRIYENNQPAKTEHYLKWSPQGAKDGMLTFTSGHPGHTERQSTIAELEYLRDRELPEYLMWLSEYRGLLTQFQTRGEEQERIATPPLFGIENSIKALRGEHQALTDKALFERKSKEEADLRARVQKDRRMQAAYGTAWDNMAKAVEREREIDTTYSYLEGGRGFVARLFSIAKTLVRSAEELPKPNAERLTGYNDAQLPALRQSLFSTAPIYDDLQIETLTWSLTKLREALGPDDPFVKTVFGQRSPREIATAAVSGTKLKDVAVRKQLFDGGKAAIAASDDPMIKLALQVDPYARAVRKQKEDEVESMLRKNGELLGRARFDAYGTSHYPDATFTLRLSYGQVKGYVDRGKQVNPMTIIGGVYERATGRDPFALPQSWLDARPQLNQTTPFNFVSTNDIIGGNSGSPVVNKDAQIVGLIFDGNIQSLGGDFWFDESVNRAVSVHSSAILEALDKVYRAERVLNEIRPTP